jgi:hypothetical protein
MSDYWSENGDILVHEKHRLPIGFLIVIVATCGGLLFTMATWPAAIFGNLLLWFVFGLELLSYVQREEFDRRRKIIRQRGVLGLKWTEPFDRFASVHVARSRSVRGTPQIRVNLTRRERLEDGSSPEYCVTMYHLPSEADENEAREWGDRLARFLDLPVRIEL